MKLPFHVMYYRDSNDSSGECRLSSVYDVAAYVWPSYHEDPRALVFWPEGFGEWESVLTAEPRFDGHRQPKRPLWRTK